MMRQMMHMRKMMKRRQAYWCGEGEKKIIFLKFFEIFVSFVLIRNQRFFAISFKVFVSLDFYLKIFYSFFYLQIICLNTFLIQLLFLVLFLLPLNEVFSDPKILFSN